MIDLSAFIRQISKGSRYVDASTASTNKLTRIGDDGTAYIGVDTTTVLDPNGKGRDSVRITTQKQFTHGLIIGDITNMPGGVCGTWPACRL